MINRRCFLKLACAWPLAARLPDMYQPVIVDGHLDLGWNMVNYGRDYRLSAAQIRQAENNGDSYPIQGQATLGLPDLLSGRVALVIGMIYVMPAHLASNAAQIARYSTPEEASAWGWKMLEAIEQLAASSAQFALVRNQTEMNAVLKTWEPGLPQDERQVGIIIGMEGADPILTPDELAAWYERGLRSIGPAWGRTRYAGSNSEDGPLTELGGQLLDGMQQSGMLLDTAHASETAFWQMLERWDAPVVYSHGNSRHFLPTERGLSDAQIQAIADRSGVVGIGLYNGFFQQNTAAPGRVALDDVVNAIDYVCQFLGNCEHVAMGSDLDGGFGAEDIPVGFDTVADLSRIPTALLGRGYSQADIDNITHGNWLRVLSQVLP